MNIRRTVFGARIVRGHTRRTTRSIPHTPPDRRRVTDARRACVCRSRDRGYHTRPHHRVHATADRTPTPDSPTTSLTIRSLRSLAYALHGPGRPTDDPLSTPVTRAPTRRQFRVLDRTRREERHQVYSKRTHKLVADPHDIQQRPEPVGRGSLDVRPRSEGFTC